MGKSLVAGSGTWSIPNYGWGGANRFSAQGSRRRSPNPSTRTCMGGWVGGSVLVVWDLLAFGSFGLRVLWLLFFLFALLFWFVFVVILLLCFCFCFFFVFVLVWFDVRPAGQRGR